MAIIKCKMCGGDLVIKEDMTVAECEYCGTKQTVPTVCDETLQTLFNRANVLRMKSEFDKAAEIYEKILQRSEDESEAYWGLILCKYGIEYVEDPKTFTRVPTCHRASYDAVVTDDDYKSALKYADVTQRGIYEAEAKAIDEIQRGIIALAQKETPYDVFICYKEADENGKRTPDSVVANDIYYQLTQAGFKVFYAAITLEDKLGEEYEPYIFSALNSAKVMLALGTKPENFNAVWVKNEWSRFLKLMKSDRSKLLIPCFRDMDAYELPEEFVHLQTQDMSKIGFINDVVRGIKKVIVKEEAPAEKPMSEPSAATVLTANMTALIKRGYMALEDCEWSKADGFFEEALNQDAECAEAYLGKLMAELRVSERGGLKKCKEPFDNSKNYQKVLRFGSAELRGELEGYVKHIIERNENAHLDGIYNKAVRAMNTAHSEEAFRTAAQSFKSIPSYKDSKELAEKCFEKAEICRKDAIYNDAYLVLAESHTWQGKKTDINALEESIIKFQTISGWKDADEQVYACRRRIEEIKAKEEAERLEAERKAEERRIAAEKAKEKAKRIVKIAVLSIAACAAVVALLITVVIPSIKYNKAVELMENGEYEEAIKVFVTMDGYKDSAAQIVSCNAAIKDIAYNDAVALINSGDYVGAYEGLIELNGYKDSATKASEIYDQYKIEKLKVAAVGDTVFLGAYEQDNNTVNGKEDIEWIVLAKEDNRILVISEYILDYQPYNTTIANVTWENCSLREWMNDTFLNAAFSAEEQEVIQNTTVSADKNPNYSTNPGNATTDKVFPLSIEEAEKYFNSNSTRQCKPTEYAVANGAYVNSNTGNCIWWLRSPGFSQNLAACVDSIGSVDGFGQVVTNDSKCVRPAMWITVDGN